MVERIQSAHFPISSFLQFTGYKKDKRRHLLLYILPSIFTLGIWALLCKLYKQLKIFASYAPCILSKAQIVKISDNKLYSSEWSGLGNQFVKVNRKKIEPNEPPLITFEYLQFRFIFDHDLKTFVVPHLEPKTLLLEPSTIRRQGLSSHVHKNRLLQFGSNVLDVKVTKSLKRILNEFKKPSHIFLVFVFIIWIIKQYIGYSILSALIIIFSIVISYRQQSQSDKVLKALVATLGREVRVIRDGEVFVVGSASLVPGDLVEINGRITLPSCDMILLDGTVQVDESTITGDTASAYKIGLYNNFQSQQSSLPIIEFGQGAILYGGSKVLKVKNSCAVALVIKTGYQTVRGKIIRSVLMNLKRETVHPYLDEINKYILLIFLSGLLSCVVAFVYLCSFPLEGDALSLQWYDLLDYLLSATPPFLTLISSWPILIANERLKRAKISSSGLIHMLKFGNIDCICYDKTGTLTDALGLYGVLQTNGNEFEPLIHCDKMGEAIKLVASTSSFASSFHSTTSALNYQSHISKLKQDLVQCMACCHDLNRVNDSVSGDKLEEVLFSATGYELLRENGKLEEFSCLPPLYYNRFGTIKITQVFPFVTEWRRMSVVMETPYSCVYAKGSPKSIQSICLPETVPKELQQQIMFYSLNGFRIIALARKLLTNKNKETNSTMLMTREEAESKMEFMGLLIMKNTLRPETKNEIFMFTRGNSMKHIRTLLVTGDTPYVAVAVGRESGIIKESKRVLLADVTEEETSSEQVSWKQINPFSTYQKMVEDATEYDSSDITEMEDGELAMTGNAFSLLRSRASSNEEYFLFLRLLVKTNIFAEFTPELKAQLVYDLKSIDYSVCMVGDGSNDILALSAADVGFNINEADTSSFAAQFQSFGRNCVSMLVKDSRALLDKIIQNVKLISVFIFIQYSVTMLMELRIQRQPQLIYSNMLLAFAIPLICSFNRPKTTISTRIRPPANIMRVATIVSVIAQAMIQICFLSVALYLFKKVDLVNIMEGKPPLDSWYGLYLEGQINADILSAFKMEEAFVFKYSNFQYVIVALVYQWTSSRFVSWWYNPTLYIYLAIVTLCNFLFMWPFPDFSIPLGTLLKLEFPLILWAPFDLHGSFVVDKYFYSHYWLNYWTLIIPLLIVNFVVSLLVESCIYMFAFECKSRLIKDSWASQYYKKIRATLQK